MADYLDCGGSFDWYVLSSTSCFASSSLHFTDILLTFNTAVIIGCAPAFAAIIRGRLLTRPSLDSKGYVKHAPSDEVQLGTIGSARSKPKVAVNNDLETETFRDGRHSSQQELAKSMSGIDAHEGGIVVTTKATQEDATPNTRTSLVRKVPERIVREK